MYKIFPLLFSFCIIITSCQQETKTPTQKENEVNIARENNTAPLATPPGEKFSLGASTLYIETISKATFEKLSEKNEEKSLIEKFCNESKGYQKDEWPGFNECRWAIEKFQLEKYNTHAKRVKDDLVIMTNKDQNITLKKSKEQAYIFKNYIQEAELIVVENYNAVDCKDYLMIQKKTAMQSKIEGLPSFNIDKSGFVVTSDKSESCKAKLEYWMINSGYPIKKWGFLPGNWSFSHVKWEKNDQFLAQKNFMHQGNTAPQYIRVYMK